jgi:hypothetical protein
VRLDVGALVCRLLPLAIVVAVWVAARASAIPADPPDQRWHMTPDGQVRLVNSCQVIPPLAKPLDHGTWPELTVADAR